MPDANHKHKFFSRITPTEAMNGATICRHLSFTPDKDIVSPIDMFKIFPKEENRLAGCKLWFDDDDSNDSGIGLIFDSDDDVLYNTKRSESHRKRRRSQLSHDEEQPLKRSRVGPPNAENDVISAVEALHGNRLIADGTKKYTLLTVKGKHADLKCISPETLTRVLKKEFDHEIEKFLVIDCRYPYEFRGGHIKGAVNLYKHEDILNLLSEHVFSRDSNGRVVLIFHCEFSSERGPKLYRFLRNKDRETNQDCYPRLHFPEMYLLNGGYKSFYETNSDLCEPRNYVPMLHGDHCKDLKHFRVKSKSWPRGNKWTFMQRLTYS